MTETKKDHLFYKFLAWSFGITVLISMTVNFLQLVHHHMGNPNPPTSSVLIGIFCCFIVTAIGLIIISISLTMICVFFHWVFKELVKRNINWVKKEFSLSPDNSSKKE